MKDGGPPFPTSGWYGRPEPWPVRRIAKVSDHALAEVSAQPGHLSPGDGGLEVFV